MPAKQFEGNPYGFASIYAYDDNGPVGVAIHGYDNNVGATGSAVDVYGGDGFSTVNIGLNNTLNIVLGGYGNTVSAPITADASIQTGTGGANVYANVSDGYLIATGGYLNTITETGGAGSIYAGDGSAVVSVAGGSGSVYASGYNNVVNVGAGAYDVHAGATAVINTTTVGGSTLTAEGYGNQFNLNGSGLNVAGPYDVVNAGAGTDTVSLSGGSAGINLAGWGNTVNLSNAYAIITDGAGSTVFNLGDNSIVGIQGFQSSDQIVFKAGGGINTAQDALSHATTIATGVEIDFGGGTTLQIAGISPTDLTAANFKAV
ncbi:hypothetical protein [Acidisphaera sp. L21]|uniref:hypothetical protein n=1 Tax=Acidisphaera sp. L21 TaxID=1641851 RepID=UPI00131A85D9|nr:hypothetical protein [Acidisphaera sp. L21]